MWSTSLLHVNVAQIKYMVFIWQTLWLCFIFVLSFNATGNCHGAFFMLVLRHTFLCVNVCAVWIPSSFWPSFFWRSNLNVPKLFIIWCICQLDVYVSVNSSYFKISNPDITILCAKHRVVWYRRTKLLSFILTLHYESPVEYKWFLLKNLEF